MLVLVVGPSGVGKDTLLDAARARLQGDDRFRFARRSITRPATPGGEDHEPVDPESFELRRAAGAYALSWDAHGLRYGIPADIALDLALGRVVVASVSRAVIAEAARRFPVRVVEITAPPEMLASRLVGRGREDADDVARRLARSVALPDDVEIVQVPNDSTIEAGAARLLDVLSRAAESARPA